MYGSASSAASRQRYRGHGCFATDLLRMRDRHVWHCGTYAGVKRKGSVFPGAPHDHIAAGFARLACVWWMERVGSYWAYSIARRQGPPISLCPLQGPRARPPPSMLVPTPFRYILQRTFFTGVLDVSTNTVDSVETTFTVSGHHVSPVFRE